MSTTQLQKSLTFEEDKLLACIHCGLCLESCPTYVATGDENDGPRGRLYLMRAVAEGRLDNTSHAFRRHIDRCLGCRACEQVCPAGVEYGQLLEASRAELLTAQPKKDLTHKFLRLVLQRIWLFPRRLRLVLSASRILRDSGVAKIILKSGLARLSSRGEFGLALLVSSRKQINSDGGHKFSRGKQTEPGEKSVFIFTGCVGEGLFARVNKATERVLAANGFQSVIPKSQVCCGALHAHAGDLQGARQLAGQNIQAFSDSKATPIITNAGGCGAMLMTYGHLLEADQKFSEAAKSFSSRIRDIGQQLQTIEGRRVSAPFKESVTYDTSCHLMYGQHAGEASIKMLQSIDGLDFCKLEGSERCCGAAGIYNLLEPELSGEVLQEKLKHIKDTNASLLATGNSGCQMHIGAGAYRAGLDLKVCHPVEILDAAYAAAGVYKEDRNGSNET